VEKKETFWLNFLTKKIEIAMKKKIPASKITRRERLKREESSI